MLLCLRRWEFIVHPFFVDVGFPVAQELRPIRGLVSSVTIEVVIISITKPLLLAAPQFCCWHGLLACANPGAAGALRCAPHGKGPQCCVGFQLGGLV